jgi:hypothetical protein
MATRRDPDLVLVDGMLAPPPVDDARSSLAYWQRRRKALPLYRRTARREARDMAFRWEGRVQAAERARFEASPGGRFLAALGVSNAWGHWVRLRKLGLLRCAWMFVPPKVKLVAGAVLATWLLTALAAFTAFVVILIQLT